jgi:uncharacterized membrane protein YraQ (UPF0718 family)
LIFSAVIWTAALFGLVFSWSKNKEKTRKSLFVAWKFFRSMALLMLLTIWSIGFLLVFLPPEIISRFIGPEAGIEGVILAALFGSVVLIQAFIAFPIAGSLLRQGANVSAVAAFVTTLVMVGVLTAPMEIKCFGKRYVFWRNFLSFVFALLIAVIMGVVLS